MIDKQITEVFIQGFQNEAKCSRTEAIKAVKEYCQYGIDHPECTSEEDVEQVIKMFVKKIRNGEYK